MEAPPKHPKTAQMFSTLLRALDISASRFAKAISRPDEEYSQQVISNYVAGKFKPGQELLAAILRQYPTINTSWLLMGEGEPFPSGRFNEKPADQLPPQIPSKHKLPVPGEATPAEADFVGRLIERLERELAEAREREAWYQEMLKKPLASAEAAVFMSAATLTPISLRPTACVTEAVVRPMYPRETGAEQVAA